VQLFAASTDDLETNTRFAAELGIGYPILADPDKKGAEAMGVPTHLGYPNRWTLYAGKDGKLLAIEKKVDPRAHGEQVTKKLAELGIARKTK